MFARPDRLWLFNLLFPVFMCSTLLAIVLTVVTFILEKRKSTPDRSFRRWVGVMCLMWVTAIVAFFGLVSTLPHGL